MSGYLLSVVHCENTRRVLRTALDNGWEWVGYTKSGHVEIRWPETDALVHCATTPSDVNAWKYFAKEIERVSGVVTWRKGNRRASRKSKAALSVGRRTTADLLITQVSAQAERERASHEQARAARRRAAERAAERERQRRQSAAVAAAEDRRRREIESLMQPGWNR